ncbi:MAG: hypothetical protein ACJ0K4_01815 [Verrucomicrobiales bacterium]
MTPDVDNDEDYEPPWRMFYCYQCDREFESKAGGAKKGGLYLEYGASCMECGSGKEVYRSKEVALRRKEEDEVRRKKEKSNKIVRWVILVCSAVLIFRIVTWLF